MSGRGAGVCAAADRAVVADRGVVVDWEAEFRRARRAPLFAPSERPQGPRLRRDELERILPHRDPLLLLDEVTGADRAAGHIVGLRHLDSADPVFTGHFPGTPIYPASLQLEMAGQLALCLHQLRTDESGAAASTVAGTRPGGEAGAPAPIVVSGVLRASFLRPLPPGATATVMARMLWTDALLGAALVQTLLEEQVCSAAVLEVAFP